MNKLYIIAGCNGAGKTTASYTILPEILNCKEFVNADEIARGLSPFQPEKSAIQAGRVMLARIDQLIALGSNFAFETTFATKSYVNTVKKAQSNGYDVTILYFWLNSVHLAKKRVELRVMEGGHSIPEEVIERRYRLGIANMMNLYIPIANNWMFIDNSQGTYEIIAEGGADSEIVSENVRWQQLKNDYYGK